MVSYQLYSQRNWRSRRLPQAVEANPGQEVVTNTHRTRKAKVGSEQEVEDGDDQDGPVQPAFKFNYTKMVLRRIMVELSAANDWKGIWKPDAKEAGKAITYTWKKSLFQARR